jgi:erythromycin esterase-like protein
MARPLKTPADLDPLMEQIGDARYVLLGEASHGTSEYYVWRYWLSRRLLEEKGFSFIAVEGDWPDCYRVNRYVKGFADSGASAREVLHAFDRWPTWMWANWEVVALTEWLRKHNEEQPEEKKAGFYGLDVYSLWESMDAVLRYLERVDGNAVDAAKRAFRCFEPYEENVQEYARATVSFVPTSCEKEAVAMLTALRRELPDAQKDGREAYFVAEQNALVVKNAETYYRTMVRGGSASWNVRDNHMVETLDRLMRFHGAESKAIVWEHNTHIGDARATDMAGSGMENVGQLVRERHSRDGVVLAGFGSSRGSVIAGREWGAPMERMPVPEAREGSWENILHKSGAGDKLLLLSEGTHNGEFLEPRGHRAIGVVYDPAYEHWGNYVPTVLPLRYDAFLYIDETRAVHPLHIQPRADAEPPETYPWNV